MWIMDYATHTNRLEHPMLDAEQIADLAYSLCVKHKVRPAEVAGLILQYERASLLPVACDADATDIESKS